LAIPGYTLPSHTILSGKLLEQENARIEKKIDNDLEKAENLILSDSIYNYVITTPKRKEYLIKLRSYNVESQTGKFMADEIQKILRSIGLTKFAAIVTDHGSNLRVARQIIHKEYPFILNLRCASYAINLITLDLAKIDSVKIIIANCNSILEFFNRSHIANGHYKEQMAAMKIKGGEIQTYTKTRWGSLFIITDSIIQSKPVFDWLINNYPEVISSNNIFNLLQNEEFYSKCRQIASILKPVKELTNILEASNANLAECFIGLIKLATNINRIDTTNQWKTLMINNFNHRFDDFINEIYILAYWLHPLYH
ncbi:8646_t:CDS:2, partial [Gigaspora margarita]